MKRILWIDFGKGFGIFLVVFAHVLANISNNVSIKNVIVANVIHVMMYFLFLIIMPIFFAMSGYLFKAPNNKEAYLKMIKKKLLTLGIPYLFFSIFLFLMSSFLKIDVKGVNGTVSLIKIPIYPISYLWFLNALFFCFAIVGILEWKKVNSVIQFCVYAIITIISFYISDTNLWYYWISNFSWILCFYIGFQLKTKKIQISNSTFILLCILFLGSAFVQIKLDKLWYLRGDFFTATNFIAKIASIFILITLFKQINDNKLVQYFSRYGKISLIIYLVHVPIISIARSVLVKVGIGNIMLLVGLILIISWYMSIFISKIFDSVKPLDIIFYPKRYIKNL